MSESHIRRFASPAWRESLLCVLLLAIVVAPMLLSYLDPWQRDGTGWHRAAPNGFALRLLDSGHYVARGECPTCEGNASRGTWERHGATITLRNDAPPHASADFMEFEFKGCPLLVESRYAVADDAQLVAMAFARDDTACHRLRGTSQA